MPGCYSILTRALLDTHHSVTKSVVLTASQGNVLARGLAVAPTGLHGEGVGIDALVFHADVQRVVGVVENDAVVGVVDKQCPCFEIVIGSGEHRELVDSQVLLRQLIVLVRDANDAVSLADVVGTQHQILPVRGDGGLADETELILQALRALVVEVLARVQRVAVRLRLLGGNAGMAKPADPGPWCCGNRAPPQHLLCKADHPAHRLVSGVIVSAYLQPTRGSRLKALPE